MNVWQRFRQILQPDDPTTPTEIPADACFWQVDMHSHLLPGVDDGVKSLDQTLEVMQQFAAWGIRKIITTPHVSRDLYPNDSTTLRSGKAQLQQLAAENGLNLEIDVAAEYLIDDFFPQLLSEGDLLTFGAERYLLVETGWSAAPRFLENVIFRIRTGGYTPVLAHPERYTYYHDDDASLARLRELGCLMQLNWASVTGRYGSRVQVQARKLLRNGWVDLIGSDLHRPTDLIALASLFGQADYELLRQQPLRNGSL